MLVRCRHPWRWVILGGMAKTRIIVKEENCTGCRACEFACSFQQKKAFHYDFSLIHAVKNKEMEGFFIPLVCYHCEDPPCAKECPTDAIERDDGSGIVSIDREKCTGCGICVDVCPTNAIEVNEHAVVNAEACTGCAACVSECPNEAIILVQKKK